MKKSFYLIILLIASVNACEQKGSVDENEAVYTSGPGPEVKVLAFYSNEESEDGEHSQGYSLSLWEYDNILIGKLSYNEGLIGDNEQGDIQNVNYDKSKGELSFDSFLYNDKVSFTGKIFKDRIVGDFKWDDIVDQNQILLLCCEDAEINKDYTTHKDWTEMWKHFE